MAVENHISELSQRHRVLDQKIEKEQSRPLIDDVKLAELKRKKLQLKDEIKRLELTINQSVPPKSGTGFGKQERFKKKERSAQKWAPVLG